MHCTNCGTQVAESAALCPNCGASFLAAQAVHAAVTGPIYRKPEEKIKRVAGYLIDMVPMLILSVLHFLPVVGWMFYGFLHICYWLLRDVNGASLGKSAMSSFVANVDGMPATTQQRILRNVPLALPGVLGLIPLLGLPLEALVALFVFVGEAVLLLATGRRFGDMLAGTNVFAR